jgi:hypothetical protein
MTTGGDNMRKNGICKTDIYGDKTWRKDGNLHRIDGPAVEWVSGSKFWYQNGKLHRDDGPAVEYVDGDKFWYQRGNLHRTDGPAAECDGKLEWWINYRQLTPAEFAAKILDEETATMWKISGYCWPFDFGSNK